MCSCKLIFCEVETKDICILSRVVVIEKPNVMTI